MSPKDYLIAKNLKKRLSEIAPIIELRVFGSRIKDTQDEYSDMDVFIKVEYISKEMKERIFDIVWEMGFENFMVISPLICTKEEVENTPLRSSPIIRNIIEEGVSV